MSIFDNATSVTINNNVVADISIGGGSIYKKSSGELRDITFSVRYNGEKLDLEVPVTVDGVSQDTVDGDVVFNIADGSHIVKILIDEGEGSLVSYYYNTITTSESNTNIELGIISQTITLTFVDEESKETIEDIQYYVEVFDVGANNTIDRDGFSGNHNTGDVIDSLGVPYIYRVYKDSSKSDLYDEVQVARDSTTATLEVPSPYSPRTFTVTYDNEPLSNGLLKLKDYEYSSTLIAEATLDAMGKGTMNVTSDKYMLYVYQDGSATDLIAQRRVDIVDNVYSYNIDIEVEGSK